MPRRFIPLALVLPALSACVTTATFKPAELAQVAGLLPDVQASVATSAGRRTVTGEQKVTVLPKTAPAAYDLTLYELRPSGVDGILLPPYEDPHSRLALSDLSEVQLRYVSPWRTVGLVAALVLGAAASGVVGYELVCSTQSGCDPHGSPPENGPLSAARRRLR